MCTGSTETHNHASIETIHNIVSSIKMADIDIRAIHDSQRTETTVTSRGKIGGLDVTIISRYWNIPRPR